MMRMITIPVLQREKPCPRVPVQALRTSQHREWMLHLISETWLLHSSSSPAHQGTTKGSGNCNSQEAPGQFSAATRALPP